MPDAAAGTRPARGSGRGRKAVVVAVAVAVAAAVALVVTRRGGDGIPEQADPRRSGTSGPPFPNLAASKAVGPPEHMLADDPEGTYVVAAGRVGNEGYRVLAWATGAQDMTCVLFESDEGDSGPLCTSPESHDGRAAFTTGWRRGVPGQSERFFLIGTTVPEARAAAVVDGRGQRVTAPAVRVPGASLRVVVIESAFPTQGIPPVLALDESGGELLNRT